MTASLRALLSGVLDYAGMFPPAELSLEQSIRNYPRYRSEPETWMLSRFICPVTRLSELEQHLRQLFPADQRPRISAIGRGLERYDDDFALIKAFSGGTVDVLETRVPDDATVPTAPQSIGVFLECKPGEQ